jgi:hypothetical protein
LPPQSVFGMIAMTNFSITSGRLAHMSSATDGGYNSENFPDSYSARRS